MGLTIIVVIAILAIWMYIIFVAADTGFHHGFKSPIEDYSNANIIKWIVIYIKKWGN